MDGSAWLWLAVVGFGVYHGLNPAMGWPLAVANGLTEKRAGAVFATLGPLGAGHFLAMAIVLLPFALLAAYAEWSRAIRLSAGAAVLLFGVYRLIDRRHPRFLARVRPTQLAWWSFLMATAHGAGLMLVPVTLGLCTPAERAPAATAAPAGIDHEALMGLMRSGLATAVGVSVVHTLAMIVSGVTIAWLVYRYLGLQFLKRGWLNLETVWAASLVLTGAVGCIAALADRP